MPGVVADAVQWIGDISHRPQPELALLSSLTALSACMGGAYALPDGGRCNLYSVGVVDTGMGKDSGCGRRRCSQSRPALR